MSDFVPYVDGWARVPLDRLGYIGLASVKSKLTITPRQFSPTETVEPIHLWDESVPHYIGLPIDWALTTFKDMQFEDRTVQGAPCYHRFLPNPHHPKASPGQPEFLAGMLSSAENYFTVFGKAPTGAGKTAVSLSVAAQRGRATLIVVQSEQLGRQWVKAIQEHLGVAEQDIGWIQSDICVWEKPFVVAIVHSLVGRAYPDAMYIHFGTVIYDELHRFGAYTFAKSIGMFPAQTKIGLTATDRRKDRCENVFLYYFGNSKVRVTQQTMPCKVHSFDYPSRVPRYMKMGGSIISALAADDARNRTLCRLIHRLSMAKRQSLVIGDRVQHLQHLMDMMTRIYEISPTRMGLFVDKKYTGHMRPSYKQVRKLDMRVNYVYWKSSTGEPSAFAQHEEVIPRRIINQDTISVYAKNDPMREDIVYIKELRHLPVTVPMMEDVTNEELDRVKQQSEIVFCTYGMLKEGQDIPRLDAGIDVTPRADGEQVLGRIRRLIPGKPRPTWYTMKDVGHPVLEGYWYARKKDYERSGAEVIDHGSYLYRTNN